MKIQCKVTLAMVVSFGLGALAVQGLHAQAKPPVYQITQIDVMDQDAYMKNYASQARASIKAAGGSFLVAGGKVTPVEGEAPKSRIVVISWESVEKAQAYRDSTAYKNLLPIREKLAKFQSFIVEGLPQ